MPFQPKLAVAAGLLWVATGSLAFAQPQTAPPPPAAPEMAPAAQQPPADPLAAARRITPEEARQAVAKGEAILVDVRGKENYDQEHAKGALQIPVSEIAARAGELPKDKLVITYCT